MDNQQATTEMDMGWLIGYIEGEGCFSLQRQVYRHQKATLRPKVSVSSADPELIERAASIFKALGVGVYFQRKRKAKLHYKQQNELVISGIKRCYTLLKLLIPYMTESRRKKTAKVLFNFCRYRLSLPRLTPYGPKDFEYGQRMRDLNGYHLRQSFRDSTRDVFDYNTKVESSLIGND